MGIHRFLQTQIMKISFRMIYVGLSVLLTAACSDNKTGTSANKEMASTSQEEVKTTTANAQDKKDSNKIESDSNFSAKDCVDDRIDGYTAEEFNYSPRPAVSLGFKHTYDSTNGKKRFSRNISERERKIFADWIFDYQYNVLPASKYRFYKDVDKGKPSRSEFLQEQVAIEKLLKKCVVIVGPEKDDYWFFEKNGTPRMVLDQVKSSDPEIRKMAQRYYLSAYMQKCSRFLFPPTDYRPALPDVTAGPDVPAFPAYRLSNFEYDQSCFQKSADYYVKKQKVEKLYEEIYLRARKMGMIRRLEFSYYPKTLLRDFADKTGLTEFIFRKEKEAGHRLRHNDLAIEYFGSYDKWMIKLSSYLDQKQKSIL